MVEVLEMFFPAVGENSNIVDKGFDAFDEEVFKSFFESSLSPVGTLTEAHAETFAAIFSERCNKDTEP